MKSILAALRTLLVLGACLGVLGFVAWLLGELPPRDGLAQRHAEEARAARAERREATRERASATATSSAPPPAEAADAGVDAGPPPAPKTPRFQVCDGATNASFARLRLDARGRELVAVGCGDTLEVFGFIATTPVSIARIAPATTDQAAPVRGYTVASEDVTGDGSIDWLIGTRRAIDLASPAVGSLHLLAGDGRGSLGDAILLAPVAVAAIDLGRVDDDPIIDLAVLHRPDSVGSRAPEAWVFRGGAAPVRVARIALARESTTLALADVDLDGFADLVPTGRNTSATSILAGDGSGGFSRRIELATPGADRFVRAAAPDRGTRLLFVGPTATWLVPAQTTPTLVPSGLTGTPLTADLRSTSGSAIELAWLADGVVKTFDVAGATPTSLGSVTLAPESGRIADVLVGDFLGDATLDLALLVERPSGTVERDLVVIADATPGDLRVELAPARPAIARAPLALTIPLR